jgi:hypothetical protein
VVPHSEVKKGESALGTTRHFPGAIEKSVPLGRAYGLSQKVKGEASKLEPSAALIAAVILIGAGTTFRSSEISTLLKIFVGIFSTETMLSGIAGGLSADTCCCLVAGPEPCGGHRSPDQERSRNRKILHHLARLMFRLLSL